MEQDDSPAVETPGSEMLRGFWYPALRSEQLHGQRLHKSMLLGVPLVMGRDGAGQPFALRDSCPHRGIPLSYGRFDGREVECSYHGWRFDARSGQCKEIPSLMPGSKLRVDKIYATHFHAEDQDGYVWVYMPEAGAKVETPPPAPRLPMFSNRFKITHLEAPLPVSVDHGIIGLMDPAHGPFVHQAWWWRSRRSIQQKEKTFEPIPNGFRIVAHSPSANSAAYKLLGVYGKPITTAIEFVLPNLRFEQIHCGDYWFSSRTTVTPVTATECRIDFCAAWNVFLWFPLMVPIFRLFGKSFIGQDQRTMVQQSEGLKYNPALMLVDDADRPAKWYFQLKRAYLESRLKGAEMQHPISGRVTLRWRS